MSNEENLDERLSKALKEAELDAQGNPLSENNENAQSMSSLAKGMQVGAEFAGGIIVGVVIGLMLDKWLNTTPIFLVIFLFLGFGASLLNVFRYINNLDQKLGTYRQIKKKQQENLNQNRGKE